MGEVEVRAQVQVRVRGLEAEVVVVVEEEGEGEGGYGAASIRGSNGNHKVVPTPEPCCRLTPMIEMCSRWRALF